MKLVCVVGPTGCGKTWLGVELAKALRGEVVSCDSMQIYRGMVIGTAAPTEEEMQGVPHHMVGVADPNENYSVARYVEDASECVDDILARGRQPVIVGGTGLYLNALLAGHGFAQGDKDGASTPRPPESCTETTKSASSARSRSGMRPAGPWRSTTRRQNRSPRATSPCASALPTRTART